MRRSHRRDSVDIEITYPIEMVDAADLVELRALRAKAARERRMRAGDIVPRQRGARPS